MPTLKAPATLLLSRQLRLLLPAIFLCCMIPLYSGQQFSSSDSAEEDRLLHPANVEENGQQQREVALAESSDEPKLSALSRRREWLIRTLQQREEQRKNAALIVQPARVLRPYGQSVPKAQSMPGPILLSALKDEKPQLRRVEVNVQSTAGLLRAKAAEDGQKQRQQQPRRLHLVNGGADGNAEGEEEAEAEMADEKAANREMEEEEEEAEAQAQAELELISNEVQQKRHPSGRVDSAKPTSKYRAEPQQQFAFSLDSEPEQQQQQKKRGPLPSPAKSFGQTQLQKWAQQPIAVARAGQQSPRTKVGPATAGLRQSQQPIRLGKQQQQPLPQRQPQPLLSLPPSQIQSQQQQQPQKLHFIYSQSQTVVNEDFAIVPNSPGLACLYGMPVPVYNTPRKQCIPHSPLCGIAFTCVMDVQAVDDRGQPVPNWWLISGAQQQQQSGASGIGQPSAEWTTAGGGGQQTQPQQQQQQQQQQNYLSTAGQGFSQGQSGFGQASPAQGFGQTTSQSHGFGQANQGQGFGGLGHGLLLDPNFGLGHGLGGGSQSLLQSQGLFG